VADLGAANGLVGDAQDRALIDDYVQPRAAVAGQDLLAFKAAIESTLNVAGVVGAAGASDQFDVAGDLEQAGDEGGLEPTDLLRADFEPWVLVGEDVLVPVPPATLSALAGQPGERVALVPFDAVQLAQVDDGVAVGLGPPVVLDVVQLGSAPAELMPDVAGCQTTGVAQLGELTAEGALLEGGAIAADPDLVRRSPPALRPWQQ
jgi:hypothetical protein